ncbi:MAG: cupin domain-containing protein [Halioglobus sp.]
MKQFNLAKEFVVMTPDKMAITLLNSPTVYQQLDQQYGDFKGHELIALHAFHEDWPSWEIHPHGDEVVVLLSGSATFVLKLADGDELVVLSNPGDTVIVPKNTWHTAKIAESASVLFITPGEGTRNEYDMAKLS